MRCNVLVATCLLIVLVSSDVSGEQDSSWSDNAKWLVRKLDQAPGWYVALLERTQPPEEIKINDSLWRTDYVLSPEVLLVRYRGKFYFREEENYLEGYPSAIYLYGRDTVLLDTGFGGYWNISFNRDSTKCATYEIYSYDPDASSGHIVVLDLVTGAKDTVSRETGPAEAEISCQGRIAFSDWADLYICDSLNEAQLVKVVLYESDYEYMWQHLADIRWSPDGDCVVLKYFPGWRAETTEELYEVCRSNDR